jgi:hypothetical protein
MTNKMKCPIDPDATPVSIETSAPLFQVEIIVDRLSIHQGPGITYPVVGQYKGGDPISVLGVAGDTFWLHTDQGYIAARFGGEDYVQVKP